LFPRQELLQIQSSYLGGWGHKRGNSRVEIEKHQQAMDRGWYALGGFWRAKAGYRVKRVIFQCVETGSGGSGLETTCLSGAEFRRLEVHRRKMNCGYGNEEVHSHVKRMKNDELHAHWKIPTMTSSLRCRRLKWLLQRISTRPSECKQAASRSLVGKIMVFRGSTK